MERCLAGEAVASGAISCLRRFPLSTLCIVAIECFDHDPISLAKPHLSMSP
jgi:hypothetical protein